MRARPVLALLPQLLVLGLGRSVVLCIGDGGHAQIEVAASLCCAGAGSLAPARVGAEHSKVAGQDDGASDCDACTDLLIVVSTRFSRVEDGTDPGPRAPVAAAPAAPAPERSGQSGFIVRHGSRGDPEPPHLLALRSIRLRC